MIMQILNIAGYRFVQLNDISLVRDRLEQTCATLALKGTILLSEEGINISLAGTKQAIDEFKAALFTDARFAGMRFHHTYSDYLPFQVLKVKLKNEIITMRQENVTPLAGGRAPDISPAELKTWLDEQRDITLLDTRNDYEYRFGTFKGAINLQLQNFGELPEAVRGLDKQKPVVMFCTGGIRCEKAALYMSQHGFAEVYQLDGGILGYFAEAHGAHYDGECFVFDERVALDIYLQSAGTRQCKTCQGPITVRDAHCPFCAAA
jgi:UPF0176 protein